NGPPSRLITVGGTGQAVTVNTAFPQPLAVQVTDQQGHPLPNITVTFSKPATGASATLSASSGVTAANGQTSVTATANSIAGSYQVVATVSGISSPAFFDLTNQAGSGSHIVFQTQPANTAAGSTINSVTVRLTDAGGNPSAGATVTMTAQGG